MNLSEHGIIRSVRGKKPLIQFITNYVTMTDCANITLALGASPIMADSPEDAAEVAAAAGALVLNTGTLRDHTLPAMLAAGRAANAAGVPVILDPVGVVCSAYRAGVVQKLLEEIRFCVIRGNASEIRCLAGLEYGSKGVDAAEGEGDIRELLAVADRLIPGHADIVAVTGAVDYVTDGEQVTEIRNGHAAMASVTGTGCMCTALIGACCAGEPEKAYESTVCAVSTWGLAGEKAWETAGNKGLGSFHAALADAVSLTDDAVVAAGGRYREYRL